MELTPSRTLVNPLKRRALGTLIISSALDPIPVHRHSKLQYFCLVPLLLLPPLLLTGA